jgi:hypothetical protein
MTRFAMRMRWYAVACVLWVANGRLVAQTTLRSPNDVLHDIARGRLEHLEYTPVQVETALKPLLATMRTSGLNANEEVAMALAYYFTFDGLTAGPILEKSLSRDDLFGRVSWQALQNMSFFGAKDYALVERRIGEFRAKFRPIPDDLEYTAAMVGNLARQRASKGEYAQAAQLIVDDLRDLPMDVAFRSFANLASHFESFRKANRDSEALTLMKKHRDALKARLASEPSVLPAGATPPALQASLQLPHKDGTIHLFPFQDGLFPDDAGFLRARATSLAAARAVDQFTRWIDAAESGKPLPRN